MDPHAAALIRLLPMLLGARFRRSGFDKEPPGVMLLPARRRWARVCKQLDLPLPATGGFARPTVRSVVLVPRGVLGAELLIFPTQTVSAMELGRLEERVALLRGLAQKSASKLEFRVASPEQLTPSRWAWAAVAAGELPPVVSAPLDLLDLVQRAPSPLARALALLVSAGAPHPVDAAREVASLRVRSPEFFIARWSGNPTGQTAAVIAGHPAPSLRDVAETGRALQAACLATWRNLPSSSRRSLRPLIRTELLSSPIPFALRGPLNRALAGARVSEHCEDGRWTIRVEDLDLAQASTLDGARARALCVSPRLVEHVPEWRRVAAFAPPPAARRALIVVESQDTPCLVVSFNASGRARAERVDRITLMRRALWLRARGDAVELQIQPQADQPLASRLNQIAAMQPDGGTLAVQIGDRLIVASGGRTFNRPLSTWLAWPRKLRWLPEQAEWLASLRAPMKSPIPSLQATVLPHDETTAVVLFIDQAGRVLREEVEQLHLEDHLREARELLREGPSPAVLSVTVHPLLAQLGGRRLNADLPVVQFDVDWEAPGKLRLRLDDDAFAGPGDPPWFAAVETVFSRWPPGIIGRVGVRRVRFIRQIPDASPLHALAVRSYVLRRLASGIRRLAWLLEAA